MLRPSFLDNDIKIFRRTLHTEYRQAVWTHLGVALWADLDTSGLLPPTPCSHRSDSRAGTTILYHLLIYSRIHSLRVTWMTTGRTELFEHGHCSSIRWGSRTFQGLHARWSRRLTKQEYTVLHNKIIAVGYNHCDSAEPVRVPSLDSSSC